MNKGIKAAQAKRREMSEQGIKVNKLTPIEKAKKDPKSLRKAINAKCWECCGAGADGNKFTRDSIGLCTISQCGLWNVRPYQRSGK